MDNRPEVRVLVDWDNDGFVNRGVPLGTAPNLLNSASVGGEAHPSGTGVYEEDEHGLIRYDNVDQAWWGVPIKNPNIYNIGVNATGVDDEFYTVIATDRDVVRGGVKGGDPLPSGNQSYVCSPTSPLVVDLELAFALVGGAPYIISFWYKGDPSHTREAVITHTSGITTVVRNSTITGVAGEWVRRTIQTNSSSGVLTITPNNGIGTGSAYVGDFMYLKRVAPTPDEIIYTDATHVTAGAITVTESATSIDYNRTVNTGIVTSTLPLPTTLLRGDTYKLSFSLTKVSASGTGTTNVTMKYSSATDTVGNSTTINVAGYTVGVPQVTELYIAEFFGTDPYTLTFELATGGQVIDLLLEDVTIEPLMELPYVYWRDIIAMIEEEDQGFVLSSGVTYTIGTSVKADNPATIRLVTMLLPTRASLNDDLPTVVGTDTVAGTGDWERFYFTVTPSTDVVFAVGVVGDGDIAIKGFTIQLGSVGTAFQSGAVASYDDISDYVLSASWKLGKASIEEYMAYEGVADITLNNDSRMFSAMYTASPLYGYIKPNLRTIIEVKTETGWHRLWTGWTRTLEVRAGRTSTRQAQLECRQGIFQMKENFIDFTPQFDTSLADIVYNIFESAGWRSAYTPLYTQLNMRNYLSYSTFLQATNDLFTEIATSNLRLPLVGMDWGSDTTLYDALKDVMEFQNGGLWVDRQGGIILVDREHYVNPIADYSLTLDTEVQNADYVYGQDLVNKVVVELDQKVEQTNQIIWDSGVPLYLQPKRRLGDQYNFNLYEIDFGTEEGKKRVITYVNPDRDSMDIDVYRNDTANQRYRDITVEPISPSEWNTGTEQLWVTVLENGDGRYFLQIRSEFYTPAWVHIKVYGNYIEGGSTSVYTYDDVASQTENNIVITERVENPLVYNEEQAKAYANWVLKRKSTPYGEFKSIEIVAGENPQQIVDITLDAVLSLTEIQTAEENAMHVVIEEKGMYTPSETLKMTYTLARLDETDYYTVGDEVGDEPLSALVKAEEASGIFTLSSEEAPEDYPVLQLGSGGFAVIGNKPNVEVRTYPVAGAIGANGIAITTTPTTTLLFGATPQIPPLAVADGEYVLGWVRFKLTGTSTIGSSISLSLDATTLTNIPPTYSVYMPPVYPNKDLIVVGIFKRTGVSENFVNARIRHNTFSGSGTIRVTGFGWARLSDFSDDSIASSYDKLTFWSRNGDFTVYPLYADTTSGVIDTYTGVETVTWEKNEIMLPASSNLPKCFLIVGGDLSLEPEIYGISLTENSVDTYAEAVEYPSGKILYI